ncbi:MAG TPA: hypothetical protein ENJ25_03405 [Firmicutes bacterium]|uniref:Uncharacterized protein n=1 Tax=candidate division TA06 bacterium TaxID=2250710 RepID=A0A660SD48_UNCT6|nr:MAG: hypothetical protein DRP44_00895 [candidate division TA06 bacterium]HFD05170.1 hypothetical protein [Bacillota bacterium]
MNEFVLYFKHRRKGIQAFKYLHKEGLTAYASISRKELIYYESDDYTTKRCYKFTFYSNIDTSELLSALKSYREEIINIGILENE